MKKLILSELLLLFLATTFVTDSPPPGWYQQTLPVNDQINDIFFLDSLTGWVVTAGASSVSDTGYIMKTTNGGINWQVQYNSIMNFNAVQFANSNTGYAAGGNGPAAVFKTTNGGLNWNNTGSILGYGTLEDLFFVNKDTGWVCDGNTLGGMAKTINGGLSWSQQLGSIFFIKKLFFINSDTGWAGSEDNKLYQTFNGGLNWNLIFTFTPANNVIRDIYFLNSNTGWSVNYSGSNINGIYKTTNSGINWTSQVDPDSLGSGLSRIYMASTRVGYITTGFSKIIKTWNGVDWFRQNAPDGTYLPIHGVDSNIVWAGGSWVGNNFIIHSVDGGGPPAGIVQINNKIPSTYQLYQNYPNPFNPSTIISYELRVTSYVKLVVYNIQGKEIVSLINQKQSPGKYQVDFSGEGLSSGVYFYKITINTEKEVYSDTKRMILVK